MGVREHLNRRPWIALGVALAGIGVVVAWAYLPGRDTSPQAAERGRSFITLDDGKTFTSSDSDESPPFTVDGKTAFRAYVYSCDGGKTKFVGYLERYTSKGKQMVKQIREQQRAHAEPPQLMLQTLHEIEIKRPGDTRWVAQSDTGEAAKIIDVRCPNDPEQHAEQVEP
jgi:hypothetical protein